MFGHTFEGPVSNDFAPLVVTLRKGGLRPPRRVVWKRAVKRDGVDYDLDSDLNLSRSSPSIERDEKGSIKRAAFAGLQAAKSFIRGQEALGKKLKLKLTPQTIKGIDMRRLEFRLNVGAEVRRLAIKIGVAAADRMGFSEGLLDERSKEFLLGNTKNSDRVRIDWATHEELEKLRPPLSHFAFVKGNGQTHRSYAILQFYGVLQLHAILSDTGFVRDDFAIIAVLDAAKEYAERFERADLLTFPEAPVKMGYWEFQHLKFEWMKKCSTEAQAVLQDDARLFF
jgi:hypothetical protein